MKIDNKLIVKKLLSRSKDSIDGMVRDFIRTDVNIQRKPKVAAKHIGIEVECFGPHTSVQLQKMLFMMNLEKYIQIAYDGSIRAPQGKEKYELRILLTETQLSAVLKKVAIFFKEAKLQTNASCGLHVHLDMRHRKADACYKKLLSFQDVLYGLVHKNRWTNEYCQYSTQFNKWNKYQSISMSSIRSKKTIEVRLHHGTAKVVAIEQWIKLLLNVISKPELQKAPRTIEEVMQWKGLRRDLKPYLKKNLKDNWFKKKQAEDARLSALAATLTTNVTVNAQPQVYHIVRR